MGIAISEDHLELAGVADAFLERSGARAEARALLDAPEESLPAAWKEMADLGWLGLHLPEAHGGSGFGLAELVIVVEALGAAIAPGPFLPTVWASAVIAAAGSEAQRAALLPGLADGSVPRRGRSRRTGRAWCSAPGLADLFLLPRGDDLVVAHRDEVTVTVPANTDATRRVGRVTFDGTPGDDRVLAGARRTAVALGRLLAAAEATGGAQTCVTMASEYAKVREQFGRVHRHVPGGEAPGRRHVRRHAARHRRHVGRGAHRSRDPRIRAGRRDRGDAGAPRVRDGARRRTSSCTAASASRGSTTRTSSSSAPSRWPGSSARSVTSRPTSPGSPTAASSARTRWSCRRRRRRYRAEVREFIDAVPVVARRPAARRVPRLRVRARALAEAVGSRRERGRAARDRRGARGRRRQAPPVRDRRLGHPDDHPARRRAADRALDPTEPRARVRVVPAVQRAGCGLRRRRHPHPAPPRSTAAGWSTARRCGPPARRTATAASPPCAPIPTSRSTTASR